MTAQSTKPSKRKKPQSPWLRREALDKPLDAGAPAPPERPPGVPYLLNRHQIVALTGLSYPTLWLKMIKGAFPRGRTTGGKTFWLSTEIEAWMAGLPVRRLKGDARG